MASQIPPECDRPTGQENSGDAPTGAPLTEAQLRRWARLIADEGSPFPQDLPVEDCRRLAIEVRQRLRERLLGLIARAIARDIHRRDHHDREVR